MSQYLHNHLFKLVNFSHLSNYCIVAFFWVSENKDDINESRTDFTIRYSENLNHLFRYSRSAGCFTCVGAKSAPCPRRGLRAYSKVLARKADILLSNKLKLRKGLPVTYLRLLATFSSALRNFPKRILHVPRFTGFAIARNDGAHWIDLCIPESTRKGLFHFTKRTIRLLAIDKSCPSWKYILQ